MEMGKNKRKERLAIFPLPASHCPHIHVWQRRWGLSDENPESLLCTLLPFAPLRGERECFHGVTVFAPLREKIAGSR